MDTPALCEQCASQDIISEHLWRKLPPDQEQSAFTAMMDLFNQGVGELLAKTQYESSLD